LVGPNEFATGQILKKTSRSCEGADLAGWAQKSPEPWSSVKWTWPSPALYITGQGPSSSSVKWPLVLTYGHSRCRNQSGGPPPPAACASKFGTLETSGQQFGLSSIKYLCRVASNLNDVHTYLRFPQKFGFSVTALCQHSVFASFKHNTCVSVIWYSKLNVIHNGLDLQGDYR
jgi:hypothetical protein